ncbi:hypothetical protein [Arthrobacter sp.]|uniref:hypothetical protein n=1 Tax=Arthrobacter sp. TaxID=1667 RepID=UPI003A8D0305
MLSKNWRRICGAALVLVVLGIGVVGLARVLASPPSRDLGPGIVVNGSATAPPVGTPSATGQPSPTSPSDAPTTTASPREPSTPAASSNSSTPAPSTTAPRSTHPSTHSRAPVTPLPPADPDDDDDDDEEDDDDD